MGGYLESTVQKFGKDVVIIGVSTLLITLSGIIILPLLTKGLGTHDYGIWAQLNVTKSLVIVLVSLGLTNAITRFLASEKNRAEIQDQFYSVFFFVFVASLVVSLLLIIFADFLAAAFFDGATQIVRITGLICLVWSMDGVCLTLFKAFRRMMRFSIFGIINAYLEIGVIAYLVLNGYSLLTVVISVFVVEALYLIVLFTSVKLQIGFRWPRFSRMKEYLNFSLPMIPGNLSSWVVSFSDKYVIGFFLGVKPVGIYSACYGLAFTISSIAGILSFVLVPTMSKLFDEGRVDEVRLLLRYSIKYYLALAIPFLFGAAILSEPILSILTVPEIAVQGKIITPIVALAIASHGIYTLVAIILMLAKKTKILGVTWIILAILNLALNVILVPRIGIKGAAITTLTAYLLASGIIVHYALKEISFNIDWCFVLKSAVASVIMSLCIWFLNYYTEIHIILTVVIGVIVYALILVLLKGIKKEEWRFAKELIRIS